MTGARSERRLRTLLTLAPTQLPERHRVDVPRRAAVALAAIAVALVIGGIPGLFAAGLFAFFTSHALARFEPAEVRRRREAIDRDLPVALDLICACLRAGCTQAEAIDAVAVGIGGPLGEEFARVLRALDLGVAPADAWLSFTAESLVPVGRALARAATSGAPLAEVTARHAEERRTALHAEASAAARRAGVSAVGPLGLCFLPAFLAVAVVPVVVGLAREVLS